MDAIKPLSTAEQRMVKDLVQMQLSSAVREICIHRYARDNPKLSFDSDQYSAVNEMACDYLVGYFSK